MPPRRKRPAFPRALGSALCLLLAVLLALGPVRPVWAALGAGVAAPVHQFTGVEPDPGTGLYHFGVRAYDPTLRRWLSADPLLMLHPEKGASRGELLNLYAYASNDPVGKVDAAGDEPGDNAARASVALLRGPKAAADQKKEDAKAAKENGWCCACHQG